MNSTRKKQIILILLAGLILAAGNIFQKEFKNAFYFISEPIQKPLWKAGNTLSGIKIFGGAGDLLLENEKLKKENRRLLEELATLKDVGQENEVLRKALDVGVKKEFAILLAEAFSTGFTSDSLLLDKGARDGIEEGMTVISGDKVFLGFVREVYDNYSKVWLPSHPESSVNVKLMESEAFGVVRGQGRGKLLLDLIPKDRPLLSGDLIVTRSFAGSYPENLLVGFVGQSETTDVSPFQQAQVDILMDLPPQKVLIIVNF